MLFLVLALPKLNIDTKNQYEIFHVPLPLNLTTKIQTQLCQLNSVF